MSGGNNGGRGRRDDAFESGSLEPESLAGLDDQDVADLWIRDPDTGAFRLRTPADGTPAVTPPRQRRGRSPVDRASARGPERAERTESRAEARAESREGSGRTGSREAVPSQRRRSRGAAAAGEPATRAARRKPAKGGKAKKVATRTLIAIVVSIAVLAGGGYGYYMYLNSRIAHTDKDAGDDLPEAAADEFGRKPINVLLIGNDSRIGEGSKYGDKGHEGLADVGILMHISADRSNATFVSIPRDTMVEIPKCVVDGKVQQYTPRVDAFNTSFGTGGAPCTVSTVQRMLGLEIDHYIMIKFKGVRDLTTAVGGVWVCTEKGIYDPVLPNKQGGTGLNLPPGRQKIQGEDALAFLRTRHAEGSDGSDLSRVEQQKTFMMSLMQELKNSASFSNVSGMLKIAQIATGAIQVDHGLADIKKLANLGQQLQKVPQKRMVFTTLPYEPYSADPANKVQPKQPEANKLWESIRSDKPLTKGDPATSAAPESPAASSSSAPAPTTDPATIKVVVDNTTTVNNRATTVVGQLKAAKFQASVSTVKLSSRVLNNSVIRYPQGKEDAARVLARAVGLPDTAIEQGSSGITQLQLLIGEDFPSTTTGTTAGPTTGPGTTGPQATDTDLRAQTADQNLCDVWIKR